MPNHWHFVLWPARDGELMAFLRWLTHTHTQRWHAHYHTAGTGHLYQGRFKVGAERGEVVHESPDAKRRAPCFRGPFLDGGSGKTTAKAWELRAVDMLSRWQLLGGSPPTEAAKAWRPAFSRLRRNCGGLGAFADKPFAPPSAPSLQSTQTAAMHPDTTWRRPQEYGNGGRIAVEDGRLRYAPSRHLFREAGL